MGSHLAQTFLSALLLQSNPTVTDSSDKYVPPRAAYTSECEDQAQCFYSQVGYDPLHCDDVHA